MYSNQEQGATARSLNIEDIQSKMKIDSNGKKAYESYKSGTGTAYKTGTRLYGLLGSYPLKWKTDTLEVESNPKNPEAFKSEIEAYEKETDTRVDGKNLTVTQTCWVLNSASMKTNFEEADTRDIEKSGNMYYELLCNNGTSMYWLASRHTDARENLYAQFGLRCVNVGAVECPEIFCSNPYERERSYYVRPVVCLPANKINLNTEYNEETGWSLIDNNR